MNAEPDLYGKLAELYDAAFSWNVDDEVAWLVDRLGPHARVVLEPACGSGRMFPAFALRGIELVGVELSRAMIGRARERLRGPSAQQGLAEPRIAQADMASFDLGHTVDGAVCPINSIRHLLTRERLVAHLECVARHLPVGSKYFVQSELRGPHAPPSRSEWTAEAGDRRVAATWSTRSFDPQTRIETESCRFEILAGPGAGTTAETRTTLRRWTFDEWRAVLAQSPFRWVACYDGSSRDYPDLPLDANLEGLELVWHELERVPPADGHLSAADRAAGRGAAR